MKNFTILSKLGDGSFSIVYKVKRNSDGKLYALKKVKMGQLTQKEKENALNEVRILASLDHPNIVSYKEAFFEDSTSSLCIIMEFAEDGDLMMKINAHNRNKTHFTEEEIWKMFVQMVMGLKSLHDRKILHRDMKCANVFLMSDGTVKLGDLNVAKIAKQGLLYTQTGTPYYASPEVWKDKPYNHKSDIWSLGCVLYEAAALCPPFRATDMQGLYKKVTAGIYPEIPRFYSAELSSLIRSLLVQNPSLRPDCKQILAMPNVVKRLALLHPELATVDKALEKGEILGTIILPRNLNVLSSRLPKANYVTPQVHSKSPSNFGEPQEQCEAPKRGISSQQTKRLLNVASERVIPVKEHPKIVIPSPSPVSLQVPSSQPSGQDRERMLKQRQHNEYVQRYLQKYQPLNPLANGARQHPLGGIYRKPIDIPPIPYRRQEVPQSLPSRHIEDPILDRRAENLHPSYLRPKEKLPEIKMPPRVQLPMPFRRNVYSVEVGKREDIYRKREIENARLEEE